MSNVFSYRDSDLHMEDVNLLSVAEAYGTPCYVYSKQAISENVHAYQDAWGQRPHLLCYAVKANANLSVLSHLVRMGCGFDIVSLGELERCLQVGAAPQTLIFSGVGKTDEEIRRGLDVNILSFNVESVAECHRMADLARELGHVAPISLRVNPNVDAQTHPHITTGTKEHKFGLTIDQIDNLVAWILNQSQLRLVGISCHIGSQITELSPYLEACRHMSALFQRLNARGVALEFINLGGGLGIPYQNEIFPTPSALVHAISPFFETVPCRMIIEPGRSIIGQAGVLLMQVLYIKRNNNKNFVIVDAGMNDNLRPALYGAWHDIKPLHQHNALTAQTYDVVGPVCESSDCFAYQRNLTVKQGDFLALMDSGAYGMSMSSQYNARPVLLRWACLITVCLLFVNENKLPICGLGSGYPQTGKGNEM